MLRDNLLSSFPKQFTKAQGPNGIVPSSHPPESLIYFFVAVFQPVAERKRQSQSKLLQPYHTAMMMTMMVRTPHYRIIMLNLGSALPLTKISPEQQKLG